MSGRGQPAKKRSGKGGNAAAKRPCREVAAVRLVRVAEVASSQASSSKDAKAAGADPHGLVGKKCRVPGSWWEETPNDKQLHPCTVVGYTPSFTFNQISAPAYYISVDSEGDDEYPISYPNLLVFMAVKDRPLGWDDPDAAIFEQTDSEGDSESDSDEESDGDGAGAKRKRRKKPKKKALL